MTKRIFITATNTDIGKTYATKLLMKQFSKMGYRIGVCKPIETGVIDEPNDGNELLSLLQELNPLANNLTVNDIVPIRHTLAAAPYIANNAEDINISLIDEAILKQEQICDILLIEGAGGLYVPIDKNTMMIDIIKYLDAVTLLISHCRLGCINDTLLSHFALLNENIAHNWTLNCFDNEKDFYVISEPFFHNNFPEYTILKPDIIKVATSLLELFEK